MREQSEQDIVWPCFVNVELAHVKSVASHFWSNIKSLSHYL